MSKGQCVVDAFKMVFASKHYHSQWIPDHFVADVTCFEYNILENKLLLMTDINSALSPNNSKWEPFEHQGGMLYVKRSTYSHTTLEDGTPNLTSRWVHCINVSTVGHSEEQEADCWFHGITSERITAVKHCMENID